MQQLTLTSRHQLDDSLVSFEFAPEDPLTWEAGQFVQVTLPHTQPDGGGIRRYFTIAAAPHEQLIRLVTRPGQSSFKQALLAMQPGDTIQLAAEPSGDVVWGTNNNPRLFIASGVGITPFYAMLKDQFHRGGPARPVSLWYFHPRTALPFATEFEDWAGRSPNFTLQAVAGVYSIDAFRQIAPQLHNTQVYVSGPMSQLPFLLPPFSLPSRQVIRDSFTGYAAEDY